MEKQISETNKIGIRRSAFPRPVTEGLRIVAMATAIGFAFGCRQPFEKLDNVPERYNVTLFSFGKQIAEYQGATHVWINGNVVSFRYGDKTVQWNGEFILEKQATQQKK